MSTYRVWGWGPSDGEAPRGADLREFARGLESVLGFPGQPPEEPAPLRALAAPRVALPPSLAALGSAEPADRARHGLGRSYRDVVRGLRGAPDHIPDLVVRPGGAGECNPEKDQERQHSARHTPFLPSSGLFPVAEIAAARGRHVSSAAGTARWLRPTHRGREGTAEPGRFL